MLLHITADLRYAFFVNGKRVGFDPVRSGPFEQFYDTYFIKGKWESPHPSGAFERGLSYE